MPPTTSVENLFPTPLWIIDLEPQVHESLNKHILATLEAMLQPRGDAGRGGSLQTNNDLQTFDEFAGLTKHITKAAEGVLKFLEVDYEAFEITGCWANINPPGAVHTPHMHPNNYLSGVYYVQVAGGADQIVFSDPRPQASMILPPMKQENLYSANEATVEARAGRMVIFPAWFMHGVPVNRSDDDRISISFNIMFSSFTETMSRPRWKPTVRLQR